MSSESAKRVALMFAKSAGWKDFAIPVAGVGTQNLITGKNRYFNLLTDWEGGNVTLSLLKESSTPFGDPSDRKILIMGYGGSAFSQGKEVTLMNDQTRSDMGRWKLLRQTSGVMSEQFLREASEALGGKSFRAAVLK